MDDDHFLLDQLLERAHRATARSRQLVAEATALAGDDVRRERRPVRCAWCRRVNLGGTWRAEGAVPDFFKARRDPDSVSHGICEDCFAALRATGRSR